MAYYQHYSFDLWLTLIKSNPMFKEQRAVFFYDNFNYRKKTLDEVKLAFRQVDVMCNNINEKTGKNIDTDEMCLMVITMMNDYDIVAHDFDLDALYTDIEKLVFNHPPVVYSDETTGVLQLLKERSNATFSILSNTGFIKGQTLRKILKELKLDELFEFQIYSDEAGLSKPNKKLFNLMLNNIAELKKDNMPALQQIIHIGDNPHADIAGAQACGISSLLINSNQTLLSSLIS